MWPWRLRPEELRPHAAGGRCATACAGCSLRRTTSAAGTPIARDVRFPTGAYAAKGASDIPLSRNVFGGVEAWEACRRAFDHETERARPVCGVWSVVRARMVLDRPARAASRLRLQPAPVLYTAVPIGGCDTHITRSPAPADGTASPLHHLFAAVLDFPGRVRIIGEKGTACQRPWTVRARCSC